MPMFCFFIWIITVFRAYYYRKNSNCNLFFKFHLMFSFTILLSLLYFSPIFLRDSSIVNIFIVIVFLKLKFCHFICIGFKKRHSNKTIFKNFFINFCFIAFLKLIGSPWSIYIVSFLFIIRFLSKLNYKYCIMLNSMIITLLNKGPSALIYANDRSDSSSREDNANNNRSVEDNYIDNRDVEMEDMELKAKIDSIIFTLGNLRISEPVPLNSRVVVVQQDSSLTSSNGLFNPIVPDTNMAIVSVASPNHNVSTEITPPVVESTPVANVEIGNLSDDSESALELLDIFRI